MSYCQFCQELPENSSNPNKHYHDHEYGFAEHNDNRLFERLMLEINQAGLSWTTILKKRQHFQAAFANFDIERVAAFNEDDVQRLMNNANIIRHRQKIQAAIKNAQHILLLQQQHGSFKNWLDQHQHFNETQWLKLFKQHFFFVGQQITREFLLSLGYLKGAHDETCPIAKRIEEQKQRG